MFYGLVIKSGQEVLPEFSEGKSVLHISRACLNNPKEDGNVYLQIEGNEGWLNICCLKKGVCEDAALDLFFMEEDQKKLRVSGSKSEVHLVGYYELALDNDSLNDDVMMDYDDTKMEQFRKKRKSVKTNGKVGGDYSDEDETNAGDDDEEDEADEDDEEDDDDDDDDEDKEDDDEDEDDDEEDDEDDDEEDDEDDDEEDDEDDDEEDDEEKDDEGDEDGEEKHKKTDKKESNKKGKNGVTQNKKRPLENKDEQTTKKSKNDASDVFEKSVIAYLKQHGKCKLAELGKLKKPENFKMKLGAFIKSRPEIFKLDKNGDIVKLVAN